MIPPKPSSLPDGLPLLDPNIPPVALAPDVRRKLDSAQGKGFRRESAPAVEQESGQVITLKSGSGDLPCRYCGALPCTGPSWMFEGEMRFKCDKCGKKQKLGYGQDASDRNKADLEGMERSRINRDRMGREDDVKRDEERKRQLDDIATNPNQFSGVMRDPRFVSKQFFD